MNHAIILAAGKGRRMKKGTNKAFLEILNEPMICHTIRIFQECASIDDIIIVVQKEYCEKLLHLQNFFGFDKIKKIIEGGKERQDSVYLGLIGISNPKNQDIVVVHNASNPLVNESEIVQCIKAAEKYGAAAVGFALKDTIKKTSNGFAKKTIDRADMFLIQTPQAVKHGLFIEAFANAKKKKLKVTDDASLVEAMGKKVKIVPCSYENIKITTQDDLRIAEGILMQRKAAGKTSLKENFFRFKVGFGQDSHKFSKDKSKKLILGSYLVPNEAGLDANSDGDVVLHALFNAISQAIGERSLGFYADEMYRNGITDSKEYLKVILDKLKQKSLKINNIGITIEAGRPKLEGHTDKIKDSVSKLICLDKDNIGINYTSGEGLTAFGKGEGMQCFAVVSVK